MCILNGAPHAHVQETDDLRMNSSTLKEHNGPDGPIEYPS